MINNAIKLYYHPEGDSGLMANIQNAMNNAPTEDMADQTIDKPSDKEIKDDKPVDDKVTDAKPAEDVKPEDPDYEMDYDGEDGKKAKMKLSDLRQQAKWLHENRQIINGSLTIRQVANQNPTFKKALELITSKAFNDKGEFQGAQIDNVLKRLESEEVKTEQKIDDTSDDIAEMQKMLEELDQDSPNYRILQRNIAAAQRLQANLNASLEQNKKFQERLDGVEKFNVNITKEKEDGVRTQRVEEIASIYDREFAAMSDESKKDGFKFIDDDEKSDFDAAARKAIANIAASGSIKSDEQFAKVAQEQLKAVYGKFNARREAIVADYHRRKKAPEKKEVKEEEKPNKPMTNAHDWGAAIADIALTP